MEKLKTKYLIGKIEVAYNLEKLNILKIELFEITNKLYEYMHITKKRHLKPIYRMACFLSSLLAEHESANTQI